MKLKRKGKIITSLLAFALLFNMLLFKTSVQAATTTVTGQDIVNFAKNYEGYPYVWGAKGPNSFDCSGFVYYVYNSVCGSTIGNTLYTNTYGQVEQGTAVDKGYEVPGDLLFFDTDTTIPGPDHVGIYIGGGQFIHAQSSKTGVVITPLSYYSSKYTAARRILPNLQGWVSSGSTWYYYENGVKATTWRQIGGSWYYFNNDGVMLTGWQKLDWSGGNDWFYFSSSGAMLTGWQYLSWGGVSNWYYFYSSGAMAHDTVIEGCPIGSSGVATR